MSGSKNGRRLDATPALTALPDGAELLALVPDTATPGRKMTGRIGKAAVVGLKGDKGDPGPSGAADGIAPSALTPAVALSATDETFVIQGGEAKPATLGAVAAAQGISFMILAPAGPFSDADTVMVGQGGEAKRTTLGDLVAHVASRIGASSGGSQGGSGSTGPAQVTGLAATATSETVIGLAWAAVANTSFYRVERSPVGANAFVEIGKTTNTFANAMQLAAGTAYDFRVSAYDGVAYGPASAVLTASTTAAASATPASSGAPLDGYASTWLGLYSVARRLRSAYTGPAVTARRRGTTTDAEIGFGADGLLDTSALVAFAQGGDLVVVKVWDQSGAGNHALYASRSGGLPPRLVEAGTVVTGLGPRGRPAMRFDGATDQSVLVTAATLPAQGSAMMLAVSALDDRATGSGDYHPLVYFEQATGSPVQAEGFLGMNDGRVTGVHGQVFHRVGAAGSATGQAIVASAYWDGTTGEAFALAAGAANNGAAVSHGFGPAGGRLAIGNAPAPQAWTGMTGLLCEAMVASTPVAGERAALHADMMSFLGIA